MDPTDEVTAAPFGLDAAIARRAEMMGGLFSVLINPRRHINEQERHKLILGLAAQRQCMRAHRVASQLLDLTMEERAEIQKNLQVELMDGSL